MRAQSRTAGSHALSRDRYFNIAIKLVATGNYSIFIYSIELNKFSRKINVLINDSVG